VPTHWPAEDATYCLRPGVAAALAVIAGIAVSDAACCTRLPRRSRGQDHTEAVKLCVPSCRTARCAKDLGRVFAAKDESHSGVTLVDRATAGRLVECAGVSGAREAVHRVAGQDGHRTDDDPRQNPFVTAQCDPV